MTPELQRIEQLAERYVSAPLAYSRGPVLLAYQIGPDGWKRVKPERPADARNLATNPAEIDHWTAAGQPGVVRALKKNAPAENRWMEALA